MSPVEIARSSGAGESVARSDLTELLAKASMIAWALFGACMFREIRHISAIPLERLDGQHHVWEAFRAQKLLLLASVVVVLTASVALKKGHAEHLKSQSVLASTAACFTFAICFTAAAANFLLSVISVFSVVGLSLAYVWHAHRSDGNVLTGTANESERNSRANA